VRRQFYRGKLKPHPKSDAGRRELPLSPGMARKLWAARPAHASGPIFTTANGTRLADRNLRRVLDRASAQAGVPWIGFHTFRHTSASMLLESGKNIRQVAAWLGHTDPAFTLRTYTHLMDDGLGDVAFLDAAVGNARATQDPETAANDQAVVTADSAG
jgi:integrase